MEQEREQEGAIFLVRNHIYQLLYDWIDRMIAMGHGVRMSGLATQKTEEERGNHGKCIQSDSMKSCVTKYSSSLSIAFAQIHIYNELNVDCEHASEDQD